MADDDGWSWFWVVFMVFVVGIGPGIAIVPEYVPKLVAAEQWPTFGPNRLPRWGVEAMSPLRLDDRHLFVLHDRYERRRGGGYARTRVERITVFDRETGEILGQTHSYDDLDVLAEQGGRLWVEGGGETRALSLPALEREAVLEDLLAAHPEVGDVQDVHFPPSTQSVRLVSGDGFLWDLHPDLVTFERLHHDTPVPSTPSFGASDRYCPQQVTLDSGRTAMLGQHSHRPALRITDTSRPVEAEEVETRHEGFLDGEFLCTSNREPVLRPDEDVFIVHAEDVGGVRRRLVSRVSVPSGLVWTHAVADWLPPGLPDADQVSLAWVEDRSDSLVLLVRSDDDVAATQALVSVDPETGEVRWATLL